MCIQVETKYRIFTYFQQAKVSDKGGDRDDHESGEGGGSGGVGGDGGNGSQVDDENGIDGEEEEEEATPCSQVRRQKRMVYITPVSAKKKAKKSTPAKRAYETEDEDGEDGEAPEDINSDDEPVFMEPEDLPAPNLSRRTRRFSPLGFLMSFCTAGLTAASTVSDAAKTRVITHIESAHRITVSAGEWASYTITQQTKILRGLNKTWSKHINSWRQCMQQIGRAHV